MSSVLQSLFQLTCSPLLPGSFKRSSIKSEIESSSCFTGRLMRRSWCETPMIFSVFTKCPTTGWKNTLAFLMHTGIMSFCWYRRFNTEEWNIPEPYGIMPLLYFSTSLPEETENWIGLGWLDMKWHICGLVILWRWNGLMTFGWKRYLPILWLTR